MSLINNGSMKVSDNVELDLLIIDKIVLLIIVFLNKWGVGNTEIF